MQEIQFRQKPQLSVVVLCFQAGDTIRKFFFELLATLRESEIDWELVLVGNYLPGSTDSTPQVLKSLQLEDPNRIKVVAEEKRGMMGWDVRSGLAVAQGEYLAFIDGDGQMPAEDLVILYHKMLQDRLDLAKTYRVKRDDGVGRKIVTRIYNIFFHFLFSGVNARDINSKPKIFTRDAYERLHLTSDDWFIDAEIMIKAKKLGLKVGELATVFLRNQHRRSYIKWTAIFEFLSNLTKAKFQELSGDGWMPQGKRALVVAVCISGFARLFVYLPLVFHISLNEWLANPAFAQPYYWILSGNLIHHQSFSISGMYPYVPNTFHVPLYPLFLAGLRMISESLPWLVLGHVVVSLVVVVLVWLILKSLLGERLAFWGTILFGLEPFGVYQSGVFFSEMLFLLFFLSAIVFLLRSIERFRKVDLFLVGVFLGLATLTRVVALYSIIFFIVALVVGLWSTRVHKKNIFLSVVLLLVGCVMILLPWALRNNRLFGTSTLSFLPAYTFYLYNAGDFVAHQSGRFHEGGREQVREELRAEFLEPIDDARIERVDEDVSALINHTQDFNRASWRIISTAPLQYVKFETIFVLSSMVNEGYRDVLAAFGKGGAYQPSHFLSSLIKPDSMGGRLDARALSGWDYFLFASEIGWLMAYLIILAGFIASLILRQVRVALVIAFSLCIALFFNSAAGSLSSGRYHFPSVPFIILCFLATFSVLAGLRKRKTRHGA